jgi:small nuclear ribonucleoprotein (snRNP)-like protein
MVELKSGDSYNGTLFAIDHLMNLHLKEVTWTSADGQKFWKACLALRRLLLSSPSPPSPPPRQLNECFIRGNCIKYFRVPEDTVEKVKEESLKRPAEVSFYPILNQTSVQYSILNQTSAASLPIPVFFFTFFRPTCLKYLTPLSHFNRLNFLIPLSHCIHAVASLPLTHTLFLPDDRNQASVPVVAAVAVAAASLVCH